MLVAMTQFTSLEHFTPSPPATLDSAQAIASIWWEMRGRISVRAARRVIHLLGEVIDYETKNGKRVEVELLGSFSRSLHGELRFDHEPDRQWPSMDTDIEPDLIRQNRSYRK